MPKIDLLKANHASGFILKTELENTNSNQSFIFLNRLLRYGVRLLAIKILYRQLCACVCVVCALIKCHVRSIDYFSCLFTVKMLHINLLLTHTKELYNL